MWLMIFAAWMLVAALIAGHQSLQNYYSSNPIPVWQIFAWQAASSSAMFVATPLIVWLVERFSLDRPLFHRNFVVHLIAAVAIVVMLIVIDSVALPALGFPPNRPQLTFSESFRFLFLTQFPYNMAIYLATLAIAFGISYHRKYRERELRNSQLETRLVQAQLNVLKVQLHPHFLFNTHNAISELIHKDPQAAEKMLSNLSALLRMSFEKIDVDEVPLGQELEFIERYLAIEKVRFHDRLRVRMEIQPDALDAAVPTMILQPLIENSIRHGIAPLLDGGTIVIEASVTPDRRLLLRVSDDGVGFPDDKVLRLKHGIGLSNTRARLLRLYDVFDLKVERNGASGLSIAMTIPLRDAASTNYSRNVVAA